VDRTPLQLRRHAEHCRDLAHGPVDERTRLILTTMATEFDDQAAGIDAGEKAQPRGR
jgi:hypothetical protein